MKARLLRFLVLVPFLAPGFVRPAPAETVPAWNAPTPDRPALDVPYVPTPPDVVSRMLAIANVNRRDILYDLGCGDGRIVVSAAKERKVRKAVGIDLDPQRIRESNENARKAGVQERVAFRRRNIFDVDFREATVVSMYLLPSVNLKLRAKLLKELRPGSRLVSHDFDMGDWQPDKTVQTNEHTIYSWIVPANAGGTWTWSAADRGQSHRYELRLKQRFQNIEAAELKVDGGAGPVSEIRITGDKLQFTAEGVLDGQRRPLRFTGVIQGNQVRGAFSPPESLGGGRKWTARRDPATAGPLDASNDGSLFL